MFAHDIFSGMYFEDKKNVEEILTLVLDMFFLNDIAKNGV